MNLDNINCEVYVCGEVNGKFEDLFYKISKICSPYKDTYVIIAGNLGLNNERNSYPEIFSNLTIKYKCIRLNIFSIKGDKDIIKYFRKIHYLGNITSCTDYGLVIGGNESIMLVGGSGFSVNKNDTLLKYEHNLVIKRRYTTIVSYYPPSFIFPKESNYNRSIMDKIYCNCDTSLKRWYYGYSKDHHNEIIDYTGVKFTGLRELELLKITTV